MAEDAGKSLLHAGGDVTKDIEHMHPTEVKAPHTKEPLGKSKLSTGAKITAAGAVSYAGYDEAKHLVKGDGFVSPFHVAGDAVKDGMSALGIPWWLGAVVGVGAVFLVFKR